MLEGIRGTVWLSSNISESFLIRDGLKQADGLYTTLFNLTLEYVFRNMQANELGATLNAIYDLVGDHREILAKMQKIGLAVSDSKTKYTVVGRLGICEGKGDLKDAEICFEKGNEFRYLGTNINDRLVIKTEINKRFHVSNVCFYAMSKLLKSKLLCKHVKTRACKSIILPAILYESVYYTTRSQLNNTEMKQ